MNEDYKRSNETFNARKAIIDAEIAAIELTPQELAKAIWEAQIIKWHRINTVNASFKAGNEKINVIEKKDLK